LLTIYRSNKAEWLAEILGQELRLNPPEITEEVNIIVSTWPSSRWLSEKLSIINNINALVKYPFPGKYLKSLVKRIIGIDPDEKDNGEQSLIEEKKKILENEDKREVMRKEARNEAEKWDWNQATLQLQNYYTETLKKIN